MRYEKTETVLRVALDMQASALGFSLERGIAKPRDLVKRSGDTSGGAFS